MPSTTVHLYVHADEAGTIPPGTTITVGARLYGLEGIADQLKRAMIVSNVDGVLEFAVTVAAGGAFYEVTLATL
jgi:hypothetical protein